MKVAEARKVIELCLELLATDSKWKKASKFKESCSMEPAQYTLGCALELMQISVIGEAESRNLVMRKVRGKIRKHFLWRHGWHPITNFNRHRNTSYEDVIYLLRQVEKGLQ